MRFKILSSLILSSTLLALSGNVLAKDNSTACYSIKDSSRRNACLAESKGSRSGCAAITDHAKRQLCDAKVSGNKTACYSIRNSDQRQACLAGMDY